jgi:hypothetical protein
VPQAFLVSREEEAVIVRGDRPLPDDVLGKPEVERLAERFIV